MGQAQKIISEKIDVEALYAEVIFSGDFIKTYFRSISSWTR